MTHKAKEIVLHGTITKAADYNTKALFKGLPMKNRHQIIEVILEEDFWPIALVKSTKIRITLKESQLPIELVQ